MTEQRLAEIEARAQTLARTDRVVLGQIIREDIPALITEIRRLEEQAAEHDQTFDLHWRAEMRGVKAWRAANPGSELVMPSTDHMTMWLLEQWQAAEARAADWQRRARVLSEIGKALH